MPDMKEINLIQQRGGKKGKIKFFWENESQKWSVSIFVQ